MRWRTPAACAAAMAASRSFLACLQGLQRLGSFFNPLSWKKTCSPAVQMKSSPQSIQPIDRKSTRLNSSHANISYAVFCLKKKKNIDNEIRAQWNYVFACVYIGVGLIMQ